MHLNFVSKHDKIDKTFQGGWGKLDEEEINFF